MRTADDSRTNFVAWIFGSSSKRESEDGPDEEPAAKKQKTDEKKEEVSIQPADVLIVKTDERVVLYSDPLRKRDSSGAVRFVSAVQSQGGRFILLQGGATVVLETTGEITHLVKQAQNVTSDTPRKAKREIENLVVTEEEDEHPALNLTKESIARTSPDYDFDMPSMGGTPFEPQLTWQRVSQFIRKANKLKQKSEDDLYKLIPELDDAEDAVHLFRNFSDEPNILGRTVSGSKASVSVFFSQREIDILVYSEIHSVEREYTWNLMPYRDRKSLFVKFKGTGGNHYFVSKVEQLKTDKVYLKHLNDKTALLFQRESE
mmetsp:Transcript_579/g.955  ORF Transcript_579/g.955 Transcript_579/m.955 type:complete len:317 (-) Transcript_579:366-1316(-)